MHPPMHAGFSHWMAGAHNELREGCFVTGSGTGSEGSMRDYYGWRARIGLIYLASSTVMEPELYAMAPAGVSIHTGSLFED